MFVVSSKFLEASAAVCRFFFSKQRQLAPSIGKFGIFFGLFIVIAALCREPVFSQVLFSGDTTAGNITAGNITTGAPLRVGAYQVDITPTEFPVYVNGYFNPRYFTEVLDPLYAKAVAIECGSEKFVFALLDSCLFSSSIAEEIKAQVQEKTGFPPDRVCISTTHTHFAPSLTEGGETAIGTPTDEELRAKGVAPYAPKAIAGTVEAIAGAIERLRPAKFGWFTAREPRHVFCRRFLMKPGTTWEEPADLVEVTRNLAQMNPPRQSGDIISPLGVPDQTIYCLAFVRPDETPIALLANYSTHYADGPGIQNRITADFFGVFARKVTELLGADEDFVAMLTNGTSGDCNCIDFLNEQPPYDYNIVGEHLAEKVFHAYGTARFRDTASLRVRTDTLTLALRRPTAEQVAKARAMLAEEGDTLPLTTRRYAELTIAEESLPEERTIPLQTVVLDDLGICSVPGELYSFTGARLRASTPFTTNVMISLANGYSGYIPPADAFELGGYTTWRGTSSLEREAEPKIRTKLLSMLRDIEAADKAVTDGDSDNDSDNSGDNSSDTGK